MMMDADTERDKLAAENAKLRAELAKMKAEIDALHKLTKRNEYHNVLTQVQESLSIQDGRT